MLIAKDATTAIASRYYFFRRDYELRGVNADVLVVSDYHLSFGGAPCALAPRDSCECGRNIQRPRGALSWIQSGFAFAVLHHHFVSFPKSSRPKVMLTIVDNNRGLYFA